MSTVFTLFTLNTLILLKFFTLKLLIFQLTEPAFLPQVVEGKLIGYNYLGRQQEHYRDLGVLPKVRRPNPLPQRLS